MTTKRFILYISLTLGPSSGLASNTFLLCRLSSNTWQFSIWFTLNMQESSLCNVILFNKVFKSKAIVSPACQLSSTLTLLGIAHSRLGARKLESLMQSILPRWKDHVSPFMLGSIELASIRKNLCPLRQDQNISGLFNGGFWLSGFRWFTANGTPTVKRILCVCDKSVGEIIRLAGRLGAKSDGADG